MSDRHDLDRTSSGLYAATGGLTTTATALGSSTEDLTELIIQNDPASASAIKIGTSAVQCWTIEAGGDFNCPVRNPALIWAKAVTSTATYNLIGRKAN